MIRLQRQAKSFLRIQELAQQINKQSFSKSLNPEQQINQFISQHFNIPHPEKVHKGGEDAYFCNSQLCCVADGVGGWAEYGIDPGLYSKELVKDNDLIVQGTDGIFDNINEEQILGCIKPFWENNEIINDIKMLAEIIAKYAFRLSLDPAYNSPFAKRAMENKLRFKGGKSDDITVVVAQIRINNNKNN
ncbi:protein phosphatase, putative [Ichthyophthirius multifiliis]|uniref:Protein phosphatase n=1 Tax=Ichthyophthirius multifiliis TaxID=5932 RepID=G0QQZ6_ICHMU|nr:protein phosphatase, putative [Ichthyophthirius multifiliis]EGR32361.1 protein phosphatase, putative [Ichthyophthirius multifiliis]|eukprot:XP_004035847.1 protein phosphatase, putative [Ichthyophthirius multifiliis]